MQARREAIERVRMRTAFTLHESSSDWNARELGGCTCRSGESEPGCGNNMRLKGGN